MPTRPQFENLKAMPWRYILRVGVSMATPGHRGGPLQDPNNPKSEQTKSNLTKFHHINNTKLVL